MFKPDMTPIFHDRVFRRLILWSIALFMAAGILLTKDHFAMTISGHKQLITRQADPGIYWGVELGTLFLAIFLLAYAFYRSRRR